MPDEYPRYKDIEERERLMDTTPFKDVPKDELTVVILVGWAANIARDVNISEEQWNELCRFMKGNKLV